MKNESRTYLQVSWNHQPLPRSQQPPGLFSSNGVVSLTTAAAPAASHHISAAAPPSLRQVGSSGSQMTCRLVVSHFKAKQQMSLILFSQSQSHPAAGRTQTDRLTEREGGRRHLCLIQLLVQLSNHHPRLEVQQVILRQRLFLALREEGICCCCFVFSSRQMPSLGPSSQGLVTLSLAR